MEELLLKLKSRLGKYSTLGDSDLIELLNEAQMDILLDTNQPTLPIELQSTLIQWAVIKYNRLGTEGQKSESFSGTSTSFDNDFPDYIKRTLNRFRRPGRRKVAEVTS